MQALRSLPDYSNLNSATSGYALGLSTAHICTLRHHRGGSYAEIKPPRGHAPRQGGGLRGEITAFSAAARRRMQRLLASVNTEKICVPVFVTLTYPDSFPESSRSWKEHLRAFRERLNRRYGKFPAIWRLEVMDRKTGRNRGKVAPHYHLLLFFEVDLDHFKGWLSRAWYEVCGELDPLHLKSGTSVSLVETWKGARSYLSKYVAKTEKLQSVDPVGRLWGVWYKDLLPIEATVVRITEGEFWRLRRAMLRLRGARRSTSQRYRGSGAS